MIKKIKNIFFLFINFIALTPVKVFAQSDPLGLNYGAATGLADTDPRIVVGRIIKASLSLLGTISVVLIIYSGFMWMIAGGEEEKISKAKKILLAAVIGLIIILSAYSLTNFMLVRIFNAVNG